MILLASVSSGILSNMAEQRKTPCLDNSQQAWLPGCPSHLVIPHVDSVLLTMTGRLIISLYMVIIGWKKTSLTAV